MDAANIHNNNSKQNEVIIIKYVYAVNVRTYDCITIRNHDKYSPCSKSNQINYGTMAFSVENKRLIKTICCLLWADLFWHIKCVNASLLVTVPFVESQFESLRSVPSWNPAEDIQPKQIRHTQWVRLDAGLNNCLVWIKSNSQVKMSECHACKQTNRKDEHQHSARDNLRCSVFGPRYAYERAHYYYVVVNFSQKIALTQKNCFGHPSKCRNCPKKGWT